MKIAARVLIVLILLSTGSVQADAADPPCPTMLLTTTAVQPSSSTKDVVSPDGSIVHVARQPLLTFNDFTNATVTLTEGQIVLNVGLTSSSSKRWADFTAKNVGSQVAFIVDDKILRTPTIKDRNTGSGFLIGPFPRAEGQKLADLINRKCVPAVTH